MVRICMLVLLLVAGTATAQPVRYELQADVPVGKKPVLKVSALEKISELRLELRRDDGKQFTLTHPALAKGQGVAWEIGDGAAGKATYKGTLTLQVAGQSGRWTDEIDFETLVRAPMKVTYDAAHLDLDKRVLQFQLSRPAGSARLVAIGEDGSELGTGSATYAKEPPGTWLSITWKQPPGARVMMLKLRAESADGIATNVELVPWSVTIDHEDVNFATDSAVIEPGEEKKLDASVDKIAVVARRAEKFMKLRLYIAGHTDTVGSSAKNRKLSLDRARAIATYFRKKGIALPIMYAGFGEDVLAKPTPDGTDEPVNRRVDYVLGPDGAPPPFKGPYLRVRADWKQLK